MSRVGKSPISIPEGVDFQLSGNRASAKGKLGNMEVNIPPHVTVRVAEGSIFVEPNSTSKVSRSMWGTTRSILANLVKGVSEGFERRLEINGVGYRAAVKGNDIVLQLGFSHEVKHPIPEGIKIHCAKPTSIAISGVDPQKVGQIAAEIRAYRPPEPYKGKGVKHEGEFIFRKEGKKK